MKVKLLKINDHFITLLCKYVMICVQNTIKNHASQVDDVTSLLVLFTYCHMNMIREDLCPYLCSDHHNYNDIHGVEAFRDYLDQNHLIPSRDLLSTSFGL